jgi:hypothetical protein
MCEGKLKYHTGLLRTYLMEKKKLGRSTPRWKDNDKTDLQELDWEGLI